MNGHGMMSTGGHFNQLELLPDVARQNIQAFYARHFPFLKERTVLHSWIDSQWINWHSLDANNPEHNIYVNSLIPSLQQSAKEHEMKGLHGDQLKVRDAVLTLSQTFEQRPWDLIHALHPCLTYELEMISKHQAGEQIVSMIQEEHQNITKVLAELLTRSVTLKDLRSAIQTSIEEIHSLYPEYSRLKSLLERNAGKGEEQLSKLKMDKTQVEQRLNAKFHFLAAERDKWYQGTQKVLSDIAMVQTTVTTELATWKRGQQLSGNGGIHDNNLDLIQSWFEYLAQILWNVKLMIDSFTQDVTRLPTKNPSYSELIPGLQNTTQGLLYQLIRQSVVIEKQPPQVMKTSTRFTTVVRLLIVGVNLGILSAPPHVKASIVSEAYAKELVSRVQLQESDIPAKDNCGTLVNNTATMEHNPQSRTLAASFRSMQLNKIKRAEKKGSECVMDEKFAIAFQTQIRVADLVFPVFTLSLPVVAIVHGNQEPHAWATVTWDNAFAPPDRFPFYVPEKMYWKDVGELLSMKFRQYVGRSLTPDALNFLAIKACRINSNNYGKDLKQLTLSWSLFAKEPLPDRGFTFWEWFYAILKLCQAHLVPLWKEGAVLGFVDKKVSEEMIKNCPAGTFLLRFSDSELGGVSISFVNQYEDSLCQTEVLMTSPFTSKDLSIRGLADRIHDLKNLTHLLIPGSNPIPKDQKFARHYSPPQPDRPAQNGYVKPQLACTLPGKMNTLSITDSQPATPQSYAASSPESNAMPFIHDNGSQMGGMGNYSDYMNPQDNLPMGASASPSSSFNGQNLLSEIDSLMDPDVLADLDLDAYMPDTIDCEEFNMTSQFTDGE